jgi:hypothetical protein
VAIDISDIFLQSARTLGCIELYLNDNFTCGDMQSTGKAKKR